MSKIIPFPALLPNLSLVHKIICPPYDVIESEQAREFAKDNPYSLLHITKSEIDFPPNVYPYDDAIYEKAARNLHRFKEQDYLFQDQPNLYIYRMIAGEWIQTGVVAGVSASEYEQGLIKQHEKTREEKVIDRTKHSLALKAHAEPVILVHKYNDAIREQVKVEESDALLYKVTDKLGVQHILWRVSQPERLMELFAGLDALYIADGHHRSATGFRVQQEMSKTNPNHNGTEPYNFFPAVIFQETEVRVFEYNWVGPADKRPLSKITMADIIKLSDEGGIMPPKSTWFAPKLTSGLFLYPF
ncbi:MAG: DUF1015 domain-containing protein [Pseudomonadota bacterium]